MQLKNQQTIDQLSQEIGADNVPMLFGIFTSELKEYMAIFEQASEVELYEHLKEISHALKSSAASFGADALCNLAIDIDTRVKAGELTDCISEADVLMKVINDTYQAYEVCL